MHNRVNLFKLVKTALFIGAITISQVGCVAITDLIAGKKRTASANTTVSSVYTPNAGLGQFGVHSAKLKGTYSGIYHCGNTTTQFILNFKEISGSSVRGNVLRTNLQYNPNGRRQKRMTTDTTFKGIYDAKSATIKFQLGRTDTRYIHRHKQRSAWLYGVMLPDASGFVMFDNAPTSRQCSLWIAKRGNSFPDEWEFLENEANPIMSIGLFGRRNISNAQKEDRKRSKCEPKLSAWLRQVEGLTQKRRHSSLNYIRLMYSDKYFVPHFGKRFHEIDDLDRQIINIKVTGSCLRDRELMRSSRGLVQQVANSFRRHSNVMDVDKGIANTGFNMLFAWLEQAKQHFNHMTKHQGEPTDVKAILKKVDSVLQQIYPVDKTAFTTYAIKQYKKMIIPRLRKDLKAELADNPTLLSDLDKLASFEQRSVRRFPEVDKSELAPLINQIKQRVNQHAVTAARTYAQERQGMQGIHYIDIWQNTFGNTRALLNNNNAKQIDQIFNARRLVIAGNILKSEQQHYKTQVTRLGAMTKAVKAGVVYENNFSKNYSRILNLPDFVVFQKHRQQARNKLLGNTVAAMSKLINTQEHERTLKEFELAYLMKSDRQLIGGKKIHAAMSKRRKVVAPFQSGGNFKHYLNALYTNDKETLTQLDWLSAKPLADKKKLLDKPMEALGALLEGVTGGVIPGRKIMKAGFAGTEEASLIYPIMAFYILNYESYNSACVEPKAHRRTVQYRWREITTINGVEFESDSGGHDTEYRVNDRFNHIFNVIYRGDGNNSIAKFADRFLKGRGKIYRDELIDGTYNFMNKNCKTKLVKRMEDNMIHYFNIAKARLDEAKRKAWR